MKKLLTVAATFFCLLSFAQQKPNTLSAKEKKEGWKLLFDGKTTKGWHTYNKTTIGAAWKVNDGMLALDASNKYDKDPSEKVDMKIVDAGNIVTDEEFDNFHLKLEWKIDTAGNSGILFYVHEDPIYNEPYITGPEMQVLDNEKHADGKLFRHRAGDLYDLINCSKETVKPALEWNLAEIVSKNGKLDLFLNGTKVVSTTLWNNKWKEMVAKSKFKQWPSFGIYKKGKICLQDHDCGVWFRNIKVKKL